MKRLDLLAAGVVDDAPVGQDAVDIQNQQLDRRTTLSE
jgi:hypothetical protein